MTLILIVLTAATQLVSLCALTLRLRAQTRQHDTLAALACKLPPGMQVELDDVRRDGSRTRLRIGTGPRERYVGR
ncbi:hypothetical protein [Kibdelosporangium aridum]|uniref:Uncharacterized protein n=1 Tax=Kibdelosporangium aridum TaxID=2030 RepID=A0A1W2EPP8_KIBAR|nr:hypothetical protein [Kibdelosporangium aridum]SMD11670.1 hypothetical protein SAMN05661093_04826 [Kibdelosporangium aridum]